MKYAALKKIIVEISCAIFVLLFVYTAISKLLEHSRFTDQLNFIVQHPPLALFLSYLVPVAELITALLLSFHKHRLIGLYGFISLLIFFTFWIIYLLLSDRSLPCTCGGVISSLTWKQHVVFNTCFIIAGIAAIIMHTTNLTYNEQELNIKSF